MKQKVRSRLLSALLAVAMLVSIMPAAFALGSSYGTNYGTLRLYADYNDEYYLINDGDFHETDLYRYSDYFVISNDEYGPTVRSAEDDKNVEDEELWYNASRNEYDIEDVYFDTGDYNYTDEYYQYTIYGYDEDDDTILGYMTIRLYVEGSVDGDIYAETDRNGYVDLYDYEDDLYEYAYGEVKGTPDSIKFTDWTNGDLYYEDGDGVSTRTEFYLENSYQKTSDLYIYGIYFEIDDSSKEAYIDFVIYDDGNDSVYGTIVINGDGASSAGDIEYSTEYNTSVTFDAEDFDDLVPSGYTLDSVSFTPPSSSKGTLYTTSSERTAVSSKDAFDYDELDEVTFAPKSGVTGDVSISFSMECYKSKSNTKTVKGTVVITIDDGSTISYDCGLDDYVEFNSDDFDDICRELTGRALDYVKFSLPTSSKGTLYAEYDGTSRGSTAAKSTDKFYVEPGSKDYALDDVVFVPKTSGAIELSYTAYNTKGTSFTGKVQINVTAGSLSPINYTVSGSNGVTFNASDFTAALKAKTTKTLSYVTFTLPKTTEGTLYYNGSTKVSSTTQYKASGSTNSLDKVSFMPASGVYNDVTINYTAKDTSGNTYTGTVVIKTFAGKDTVISYSTTGPAAVFKATDFSTACALKLNTILNSVQFILPDASQGTLYYGYGTSQQTRVSASARYIATTHLNYVSFLPKAGFSGTVTIRYTGYDTAGGSYTGTIQVTVTPPAKSAYFTDAAESWVAPAADFLYTNNVYSGVVSGSTLGVRSQITRGEMMQMIYNAFNLKNQVSTVTSNFSDVPATHPYYTAINAGNALGIALGDQGMFRPDEPITRQDACTLLYRAFVKLGLNLTTGTANDLTAFSDYATVGSYATDALASMVKSSIIQGDNGKINPKGNLTRGEISVILYRAITL